MSATKKSQRGGARARLEREMAARAAEAARKRRQGTYVAIGVATAIILVVVLVVVLANAGGSKKKTPAASASSSAAATSCAWNPNPNPSASPKPSANPHLKNVGTPATTGMPRAGTQTMQLVTNLGAITVVIDDSKVPCAAASFTYLASKHFFDNTKCYRLHNSGYYILQCGDPTGTGSGGPSYSYTPENLPASDRPTYTTGEVAVGTPPTAGDNGSQFFIVYRNTEDDPSQTDTPTSILPGQFTVLGHVDTGLDVVSKVAAGGLTPASKSDPNTGAPKTPLTISTLTVTPPVSPAPAS